MTAQRGPYSEHLRERVVHMYLNDGKTFEEIADEFAGHPSISTCRRIMQEYLTDGAAGLRLQGQNGRQRPHRQMDATTKMLLVDIAEEEETHLLKDMARELELRMGAAVGTFSTVDICRALHELDFVRVRVTTHPYEADPRLQQHWVQYCRAEGFRHDEFIFIDEVSVDSRVTNATHAWVPRGKQSKTRSLFWRGQRYTTIAAISHKGVVACMTLPGSATGDIFQGFIANQVLPLMGSWPGEHSVLVMDNCRIHKKDWLIEVVGLCNARAKFIPPYSPEYNPIEKLFGVTKRYLRHNAVELSDVPADVAIGLALDVCGSARNCKQWIVNAPGNPYGLGA